MSGTPKQVKKGDRIMTKTTKQQPASRPPVDALQYEKLALSAFDLCDRQMSKLETLIALAATLCKNPAITSDDRRRQRTMLELLVQTGEQYQQELACDRELFQVIALDAKGIAHTRITAGQATRLLADASKIAAETPAPAKTTPRKRTPVKVKSASSVSADIARQPIRLKH
ncbi:UNVERIFIED_ORG: hypothetical protein ABIC62_002809 [Burkholderia sp. 1595]|uniref:Uncharacterized protein n=2 Tax=Paraburkholderia terricola TaxID=169427 RepID=A0ABU1LUG6_9BURK|nr:hypothetical protein [Paraburkholderia terricola]MDR6481316.1 hypothetical protein [Paraburkholderia terricola]